jgi:hypothetical protein
VKQLLIYESPFVLNREQHKRVRVKAGDLGYAFARDLNSAPITAVEFAPASRDYPIVFAGEGDNVTMPAVLTGLTSDSNLYVEADGQWAEGHYIPAFFRRYPFVTGEKGEGADDFNVCIDAPALTEEDTGIRLFEDSGENSTLLEHAVTFLADYQREVERTQALMKQIVQSGLLEAKTVRVEREGGESQTISGFSVVDEERLQKLNGKALAQLAKTGALGFIYVHLLSLANVQRLAMRADVIRAR